MTAEPDLLPCPGCNGASVRVIGGPGAKGGPQYRAGCDYCRWRTWGNTEAEAIAAWNRRTTAAKDAEAMTAEPGLLPLPEWCSGCGESLPRDMQNYARANVAHATAPLQAEVEALRAEVDEWKDVARCASEQQDSLFREARALSARADNLRAEVERLTFEMERLQQQYDERTACMIVHRGSALACSDAVRAAYSDEHERAERLAEALRRYRNEVPLGHQPHMLAHEVDALLNPTTAQENNDA